MNRLFRLLSPFNIFCLESSVRLFDVEGNLIPFDEILESSHVYGRIMDKKVITIFLVNKSEALLLVKPFNCSFSQN